MPSITINRKVFEKLVGKKLPLEKLKDRISYLGTDLEEVTDDEIKVEIFPNRPDMLSEQGFARAFSTFIDVKKGLTKFELKKSDYKVIIDKSVNSVRPFTTCAIVKNLKFDDEKIKEIIQIQEKLHVSYGRGRKRAAIGIYPLEKIKLPITYIAKKPEEIIFQPLEHKTKINGNQILTNHLTGKEYAHLLEGKKVFPIFIDSDNKILSMPPIINSHDVGKITETTKDVFIECSGHNFKVLSKCLNFIVTSLYDMGGDIYEMTLEYPDKKIKSPNLEPKKMKVDKSYINKRLGLDLKEQDFKKLFEKMGYDYKNDTCYIPCYRTDILHQADLSEDIAIAYGYENFEETIPNVATIGKANEFNEFSEKIIKMLTGIGLIETNTYCIMNKEEQTTFMDNTNDVVELLSSVSEEYNTLRSWMIPQLMKVLSENKHHEYPQNIFEAGKVFIKNEDMETGIKETTRLGVLLCGPDEDYTKIRQVLDLIFKGINKPYEIIETNHKSFIDGRVARIKVNGKEIAYIGEIHPKVLTNFGIEMPVSALEINLRDLFEQFENEN